MNPVIVMRAARTVRDELDGLMGGDGDGLRGRLDPLLAEAGSRPPERLADAVILLVAEYGPAWDRFTALLSLDRGLTAEQVIPLLSRTAGTGAAPRDPDAFDAPSTGAYTPAWLLPRSNATGAPRNTGAPSDTGGPDRTGGIGGIGASGAAGGTGPGAGESGTGGTGPGGYGPPEPGGPPAGWGRPGHAGEDDIPSTGAMSFDWSAPGQVADPSPPPGASPAAPPAAAMPPSPWAAPSPWAPPPHPGQEGPSQAFHGTSPSGTAHWEPLGAEADRSPGMPSGHSGHSGPSDTPGSHGAPAPSEQSAPSGQHLSSAPHEPSGQHGSSGQHVVFGAHEPSGQHGQPGTPGPSGPPPAPAGDRGPSVLGRLTGAFRKRRKETPSGPPGPPGPPWEAVPLIEAPAEAVAGWGVGIAIGVDPGQGAGGTTAPAEPVELEVQVVAEGFDAPGGWRVRLRADAASPYPRATINLVAPAQEEPEITRQVQAIYSVGGQVTGFGLHAITVHDSPGRLGGQETSGTVAGTRIRPALMGEAADVTAVIVHGDEPGRLWWTYRSPHFVTPDRAELCDLGTRTSEFGRRLTGRGHLSEDLGREIGSRVPWGFWELLNAVAARVAPRRPSVLFLSQEPHVPWELAALEQPYDPSLPSHLSCQAVTGRWPFGGRRPELPPPTGARADRVAVVCEEGRAHPLLTEYGALRVSPALGEVLGVLEQGADIVHFAAGGSASEVPARDLAGAPFVFLEEPGDAQAFLLAGACAVVAPLWPVDGDGLAREFYGRCFAGEPVAEVLRSMRGRSPDEAGAYRLHGHPGLRLHRTAPPPPPEGPAPV
ncbi:hypothetical protein ACLQ2R_37095 [Streptosporangium sp. DT93]|uniref:hypothetical protein n=1 Tax=Streptosporangium sp. DT93 TaxID=3393428 RepID=UPI003CF6C0FD